MDWEKLIHRHKSMENAAMYLIKNGINISRITKGRVLAEAVVRRVLMKMPHWISHGPKILANMGLSETPSHELMEAAPKTGNIKPPKFENKIFENKNYHFDLTHY